MLFALTVLTIFSALVILFIRLFNKVWWKHKAVRVAAYLVPVFGLLSIAVWFSAHRFDIEPLKRVGSVMAAGSLVLLLGLTLSLPFSGILNFIHRLMERRRARQAVYPAETFNRDRRVFLKGAAAALPLVTVATGGGGIARAFQGTNVYLLPMKFPNLPPELNGLRILHLTDSHLGIYKMLDDFEEILLAAEPYHPDIILLTGDIADDLALLPDTLKMAAELNPPYGAFASLGNHEYYRGINEVHQIFASSPVPLLKSSGITLDIKGTPLYLAAADDPKFLRRDGSAFLHKTITAALDGAPSDGFKILMTHRPEGFDIAADYRINLTLSGHTHGGQVGVAGRSFFAPFMPGRYLWGHYQKGNSQMYLSSGIGHWFPFRLGCPPEAPVIELRHSA